MTRRIDAGDVLAAVGGLLLFAGLFLDWFDGLTAWQAFEVVDLLLAAGALAAIFVAARSLGVDAGLRVGPGALAPLGIALVLIVAVQLIEPPPAAGFGADRETGAWLALAGAILVLAGGLLRVARVSVTVDVGNRGARERVPAVDRRPPPPDAAEGGSVSGAVADPQRTQPIPTTPPPEDR